MGEGVFSIAVLTLLLSVVVITDCRKGLIRNWTNAALLTTGLAFGASGGLPDFIAAVAGAIFGGAALLTVAWSYRKLRRHDGLGLGDVKFMVGAGAWVLPQGIAPLLLFASGLALAFVVLGLAPRVQGPVGGIAFGPFLSLGCFMVYALQLMEIAPWIA